MQYAWDEDKAIEKPILSGDQFDDIQRTMQEALEHSLEIELSYFKNKRIRKAVGKIKPPKNGRMEIVTNDDILVLKLEDIVGANLN
ncbi:YolD-like family protein [Gracilibacillus xinjiangensis]|uniref:YolD-like family protein n=1 Tax=Gracilibacillus xinjiangensis TaxID=1193282 RepID=A0ABV8WQT5_9BACI